MNYVLGDVNVEPLTLTEVKDHIRIIAGDCTEDITVLQPLITAAREFCENRTGLSLAQKTIEAYPSAFASELSLPRPPVVSVESITYTDGDGRTNTLDPSKYAVDTITGRVVFLEIPDCELSKVNPIKITYTAGSCNIPMTIRQAMLLLIGHWYTNREAVVVGAVASADVSLTVNALLNQHKRWWF